MNARRRITLLTDLSNLITLERFISACSFIDEHDRNKSKILATEFFDNIVMHSVCGMCSTVSVTVEKIKKRITIRLKYSTKNFGTMLNALEHTNPHYDASSLRYRGLGLRMCRNLASDIRYKKGLFKSSIIIIL
jgi:anti-sigma regulatory factor (Ser/Thr protein kinase)